MSHFDEIWHTTADIGPDYSHVTKNGFFKIHDGDSRYFENRSITISQ